MIVPDIQTASSPTAPAAAKTPMLRAHEVSKRVSLASGELTILEGVSLSIEPGERVAIVGASGSGKSTLLSLLAGLDLPSTGSVELAGVALNGLDEDGRAKLRGEAVGFVFQSFQLLPSLTALENVALPLELRGEAEAETKARQVLTEVGLGERLQHVPKQLSGGEQQRVALARAFVVQPKLLFADEPTGNLDTRTGADVVKMLLRMNAEAGTTLVLVTHDASLAARCDRSLHLDGGRLVDA